MAIDKELQESLAGMDSGLLKKSISQFNEESKPAEEEDREPTRPKYPVLVPGKYVGSVALSIDKVKSGDNAGRPKIVFALTVSKGDLKGGKAWHHRVIQPTFLDRATDDDKEHHLIGILKLLNYCGVAVEAGDDWNRLVVKVLNIGGNTNMVRFTLKQNPSKPEEMSPYIDGTFWEDTEESLFTSPIGAGERLPDGRDFPV